MLNITTNREYKSNRIDTALYPWRWPFFKIENNKYWQGIGAHSTAVVTINWHSYCRKQLVVRQLNQQSCCASAERCFRIHGKVNALPLAAVSGAGVQGLSESLLPTLLTVAVVTVLFIIRESMCVFLLRTKRSRCRERSLFTVISCLQDEDELDSHTMVKRTSGSVGTMRATSTMSEGAQTMIEHNSTMLESDLGTMVINSEDEEEEDGTMKSMCLLLTEWCFSQSYPHWSQINSSFLETVMENCGFKLIWQQKSALKKL